MFSFFLHIMKKGNFFLVVTTISLIVMVFAMGFASALSFSDWIKGIISGNKGITGDVVDNTPIYNSIYCSDSDGGVYSNKKGTVTSSGKRYIDVCYNYNKTVFEYYCSGANYGATYINCPSSYECSNGECKPPLPTGKPISFCQVISEPGDYYLNKDIIYRISDQKVFNDNTACIVINSSNVNLNLNNKKLNSIDNRGIGILSYGVNYTYIFNGTIISNSNLVYLFYGMSPFLSKISFNEQEPSSQSAFNQMVILNNTYGAQISNNTFKKLTRYGESIYLFKADHNGINHNLFNHKFSSGRSLNIISLEGMNNISHNVFNNASVNIEPFFDGDKYFRSSNFFVQNKLYNSSVYFVRNEHNVISSNNFLDNSVINLILSSDILISNNVLFGKFNTSFLKAPSLNSIFSGIFIQSSIESRILNNEVYNSDKGLTIAGKGQLNLTIKNNIFKNNSIGLLVSDKDSRLRDMNIPGGNILNLTIENNRILNSIKIGMELQNTHNNSILNNTICYTSTASELNYDIYCSLSEDNFGVDNTFNKRWKCVWANNEKKTCP